MRHPFLKYFLAAFAILLTALFQDVDAAEAMDTLVLTLNNADSIFQSENLQLLANHMNVDVAAANVIAARLWDNPVFYTEMNIWNPQSKKAFDVNNGGQLYLQVQQLFQIGGERHKLVQYNKANQATAQYAYYDLLRNLKFQLRSDFYELNALLNTKQAYLAEIDKAKSLEKALSEQYDRQNIALKDLVRIQSTLFQLQADYNQVQTQISDLQSELRQLLRLPTQKFISPSTETELKKDFTGLNLDSLYSTAMDSRADLKADETQVTAADWNLKYQRSRAVPDLTLGTDYFNNGAASFPNYFGLQLAIPLPVLNRNQGAIKEAKAILQQQKYVADDTRQRAINEVNAAYEKLLELSSLDIDSQKKKNENFDKLMQNITGLYVRKEMSLKDLSDFMDLYREQSKAFNEYQAKYQTAREELNYAVGKGILK